MEEAKVSENHLNSAAAFVVGGIQEACDDACSICLDPFCDSDPSTLTCCKHEFHLQCVLEWCQRSSQCPMCWQSISLKDPGCQELLEAVEHERAIRMNPPRTAAIFHHPTLGDFELQHLPANASETELEERIIQHLAAAAAMGRARHLVSREGRGRSSHIRPHYLVLSTNAGSGSSPQRGPSSPPAAVMITGPNAAGEDDPLPAQADQVVAATSGSSARRSPAMNSPSNQDRAGPSDLLTFSESLKSRFSALSTRYKESITKSTRTWKERLFARNICVDSSPGGQNAVTISRMVDHLQISENSTPPSPPNIPEQTANMTAPLTMRADASSPAAAAAE